MPSADRNLPFTELALPTSTFPLKRSSSGRFLVDHEGKPFLINGDSAWPILVALTQPEIEEYLFARTSQGFNAILISLVEHASSGSKSTQGAPANQAGQSPFLIKGDFSTPNDAYFSQVDFVLARAAELHLAVFVAPCFLGAPGTGAGWFDEVKACGVEKMRTYGAYLGKRYGAYRNIIWVYGGDRNPEYLAPELNAMRDAMRLESPNQLWTAQCQPGRSAAELFGSTDWLALNAIYSYGAVPEKCAAGYASTPVLPSFLLEAHYENDFRRKTSDQIRTQSWQAALSGTCGQFFGSRPVWLFDEGWQSGLNSPGARYQTILARLLYSRKWELLVPQGEHFIKDPAGEEDPSPRIVAAITSDGITAIVYIRSGGTLSLDLSTLSGRSWRAWWYNPRTGEAADAGPVARKIQTFNTPTASDWVLVIDDDSKSLAPPGNSVYALAALTYPRRQESIRGP